MTRTPTFAIVLLLSATTLVHAQVPDPLNDETCTPDSVTVPPVPPITPGDEFPLSPQCAPPLLPGTGLDGPCSTSSCESVGIDDSPPVNNRLDTVPALGRAVGALYWGDALIWTRGNDGAGSGLDADLLDGLDSTTFLGATAKAADSDKVDGLDSTAFLAATAKATDSDKLDGLDSGDFLGTTAKAADSDKLDGTDGAAFIKGSDSGLRLVSGLVNPSGGIVRGGGFTTTWHGCGSYTVTFSNAFSTPPIVLVSAEAGLYFVSSDSASILSVHVQTWNQAGDCDSRGFNFMALGPA